MGGNLTSFVEVTLDVFICDIHILNYQFLRYLKGILKRSELQKFQHLQDH